MGLALLAAGLARSVVACGGSSRVNMLPVGRKAPFVLAGVRDVVQVSQLTGRSSPNKTNRFEVAGQDLGSMFEADGKTWFVFGDTYGERPPSQRGAGGTIWRSNTLAYTTDTNPGDGIILDGYVVNDTGWAKELLSAKRIDNVEFTVIPTYGFAANGAMYLEFASRRCRSPASRVSRGLSVSKGFENAPLSSTRPLRCRNRSVDPLRVGL